MIIIVSGVAGSGKTTVGALLAGRLRWRFIDGDTLHPQANLDKMHAGVPLDDEDRAPWLRAVTGWMDERGAEGTDGVITCSALKRSYRELLLAGRADAALFFLIVDHEVLLHRVCARPGHFFPEQLLQSQFDTLEMPSPADEPQVRLITADGEAMEAAAQVVAALWPYGDEGDPAKAAIIGPA